MPIDSEQNELLHPQERPDFDGIVWSIELKFQPTLRHPNTMNIPQGNSKEDLKQREEIIDQVYRRWTEENPDKRVYNRSLKRLYQHSLPLH